MQITDKNNTTKQEIHFVVFKEFLDDMNILSMYINFWG